MTVQLAYRDWLLSQPNITEKKIKSNHRKTGITRPYGDTKTDDEQKKSDHKISF